VRLRALEDRLSALPDDERRALLAVVPVLEQLGDG
jgi:hypothetical protein